jgi:hypothetical protein
MSNISRIILPEGAAKSPGCSPHKFLHHIPIRMGIFAAGCQLIEDSVDISAGGRLIPLKPFIHSMPLKAIKGMVSSLGWCDEGADITINIRSGGKGRGRRP